MELPILADVVQVWLRFWLLYYLRRNFAAFAKEQKEEWASQKDGATPRRGLHERKGRRSNESFKQHVISIVRHRIDRKQPVLTPTFPHQVLTVVTELERGAEPREVVSRSCERDHSRDNEEAQPVSLHQEQVDRQG